MLFPVCFIYGLFTKLAYFNCYIASCTVLIISGFPNFVLTLLLLMNGLLLFGEIALIIIIVVVVELPQMPEDDFRSARTVRGRLTSWSMLVHVRSWSWLWLVGWGHGWRWWMIYARVKAGWRVGRMS